MRPKIIFPVVALGVLLGAAAWLLHPPRLQPVAPSESRAVLSTPPEPAVAASGAPAATAPQPAPPPNPNVAPDTNAPGTESPEARQQAYVENRISELMDLAMDDQPASLQIILGELTNREPQIRHAAVEAAMQFGSRDAIPRLKDAADQTDDIQEKAAINEAIEFLKLPSPAELAALRAANTNGRPGAQSP